MSPPRLDWRVRGGSNFISRKGRGKLAAGDARRDWLALADAVTSAGGEIVVVPPPDDSALSGAPYTAEAGHFARDDEDQPVWLLPCPTAPHRKGEVEWLERFFEDLVGWRTKRVDVAWEGQGDAIALTTSLVALTWGVGPEARTSPSAARYIRPWLAQSGLATIEIEYRANPWFHGNVVLAGFRGSDGHPFVLCYRGALTDDSAMALDRAAHEHGFDVVELSHHMALAYATNALQVGTTVLVPPDLDDIHNRWEDRGLTVVEVELPALFGVGGGAGVCLSNRLVGARRDEIPADHLFCNTRHHWQEE